ncbi:hypothetical protein [Vibrio splendidus]|uniref:hypothetical protein n=1 Tax=Vibrio splendidus TaxID=29497 RepID=UPI00076AA9FE|nr:hypothetical protein [Vibrio splendidus]
MWNFIKLKSHLDSLGEKREIYIDYLESVSRTIDIYEFHKSEAYERLAKFDTTDPEAALNLVFCDREINTELEYQVLESQAHLQAAMGIARSMYDIFAQLANILLIAEPQPVHACYIHNIADALPDSPLKTNLRHVLASYQYRYVSGFVNTIKHRNLVKPKREFSLQESKAGIVIEYFAYGGEHFNQEWAIQALQHSLTVKNQLIDLGRMLNQECGVQNA